MNTELWVYDVVKLVIQCTLSGHGALSCSDVVIDTAFCQILSYDSFALHVVYVRQL